MLTQRADPRVPHLHALRIKGFAKVEVIAEIADLPVDRRPRAPRRLAARRAEQFREPGRCGSSRRPGDSEHARLLGEDVAGVEGLDGCRYERVPRAERRVQGAVRRWQLRDGAPNDHTDAGYDAAVVADLVALHDRAVPVVRGDLARALARLAPYERRLGEACQRLRRR